jgi:hypothetical protein
MCFSSPSPPPVPTPPPLPPQPMRADEQNMKSQQDTLDLIRRRQGRGSTILTGGLGDPSYGSNVSQAAAGGGTSLGTG